MIQKLSYDCNWVTIRRVYVETNRYLEVFDTVYEPSDDSWLALHCINKMKELNVPLCIDIGAGTGVLGILGCKGYRIFVDINPCSTYNVLHNIRNWHLDHLADVVQCDNISCLRCLSALYIYNTPYLPVNDDGLEGLAWSGGLREALRLLEFLTECRQHYLVIVFSSLSGDSRKLVTYLREREYNIKCTMKEHLFFEDIIVIGAHKNEGCSKNSKS